MRRDDGSGLASEGIGDGSNSWRIVVVVFEIVESGDGSVERILGWVDAEVSESGASETIEVEPVGESENATSLGGFRDGELVGPVPEVEVVEIGGDEDREFLQLALCHVPLLSHQIAQSSRRRPALPSRPRDHHVSRTLAKHSVPHQRRLHPTHHIRRLLQSVPVQPLPSPSDAPEKQDRQTDQGRDGKESGEEESTRNGATTVGLYGGGVAEEPLLGETSARVRVRDAGETNAGYGIDAEMKKCGLVGLDIEVEVAGVEEPAVAVAVVSVEMVTTGEEWSEGFLEEADDCSFQGLIVGSGFSESLDEPGLSVAHGEWMAEESVGVK